MRKAMVDTATGVVLNVILDVDGAFTPPDGTALVDATADAEIGGVYEGGVFVRAPRAVESED